MFGAKPGGDVSPEFLCQAENLLGIAFGHQAGALVPGGTALCAICVQGTHLFQAPAYGEFERLYDSRVVGLPNSAEPGGGKRGCGALERGVVCDRQPPVRAEAFSPRLLEVSICHR